MQHPWLKCELERHTRVVVSVAKREEPGQEEGRLCWQEVFLQDSVRSPTM